MKSVASNMDLKQRDKLFHFRPMLFAAFFLCFGITFAYLHTQKGYSFAWLWAFPISAVVFLAFSEGKKDFCTRVGACLFLTLFFFLGFCGFESQIEDYQDCTIYQGEALVSGRVENKKIGKYTARLELGKVRVNGTEEEGVLVAYLPTALAEEICIADRVYLRGEIQTNAELFDEYGFRSSEIHEMSRYRLNAKEAAILDRSTNAALRIRARMEKVLYAGMDETPAALTLGLLTGDMSGVDSELVENMRHGGISHLFAVSGLNVGALFGFCLLAFHKTPVRKAPKSVRFLLVFSLLVFYAAICGFSASVVRATLLCLAGYFLKLACMGVDLLEALGVSAILILLWSPCQLFDVGFQLSFLACFGLLFLTKPIGQVFDELKKGFRKIFPRRYTKEEREALAEGDTLPKTVGESVYVATRTLLSASLAAQIATLPALLLHFNFVSGWSLLLNFIFVPIIDGMFTALLLITLLACCLPTVFSGIFLYAPSALWSALTLVFEVVDFSSFALKGVRLTAGICIYYFLGLTFLSDKWNVSKGMKRALTFALLGACVGLTILANC